MVRELPAEGDSIRRPLTVIEYTVEVQTGTKMGAGTDANVFLNIFGDYGDTGDRLLEKSNNRNKFERGQTDLFRIEAVTLKNLKKIRIGHDGEGAGDGWFLKQVKVSSANSKYDQTFECNKWLATDEDDGQIVREFLVGGNAQGLETISYNVKVKTGDVRNAGTDADVTLKMFGSRGDSGAKVLRSSDNHGNKFERGKVDEFMIEGEDIGKIERIQIGHDGKGAGSGWFLDGVEIDVPSKGVRYMFTVHRWLDKNEGKGLAARLDNNEFLRIFVIFYYFGRVRS